MISKLMKVISLTAGVIAMADALKGAEPKRTSNLLEAFLKSVVSIEQMVDATNATPVGTGFLFQSTNDCLVLFTAKHVVSDKNGAIYTNLAYRLNLKAHSSYLMSDAVLKGVVGDWFLSTSADVACRLMGFPNNPDLGTVDITTFLESTNLAPGAPALILGFPMGIRSQQYTVPIVRRGLVAQAGDNGLLIDGFTFPGNSGGPVLYAPPFIFGPGFTSPFINEFRVIGIVSSYIPYQDVAISPQTKRPRIVFEENSGLCSVVPTEELMRLLARPDFMKAEMSTGRKKTPAATNVVANPSGLAAPVPGSAGQKEKP